MKTLMGSPSSSSSSSGGFNQLPDEIKKAFMSLGSEAQKFIGDAGYKAFTPIGETDAEKRALEMINKGFTPTQESLNSDIQMQMNPYDSYVIDEINRQAGGQYSVLKQAMNQAGQFGSNRQMLGANDIDLTRLGQIGQFKQSQFNNSLQNALNALPQSRRQDAAGMMGGGEFQRNLGLQTSTAPIQALQALAQVLGVLPKQEGSTTSTTKGASGGLLGSLGAIGSLASGIGTIAGMGAGAGLWGGLDPSTGITWNSGR